MPPHFACSGDGTVAHYTFVCELTLNNFYQRNCVDLEPVSIIRCIFQFEFQIVWDSDPSGFGCPSLLPVKFSKAVKSNLGLCLFIPDKYKNNDVGRYETSQNYKCCPIGIGLFFKSFLRAPISASLC